MRCSSPLVLLVFLSVCLNSHIQHLSAAATNTISQGKSLSGNQTMVSKGGNFELGFFRPGNSLNFYIGIWYKKVSKRTVVWVANREAPVSDPSVSELKISDDGNIVLLNSSKITVWSTNSTIKSQNSSISCIATLHDNGNLVLKESKGAAAAAAAARPSRKIWQSFDHPTDTWLPGAWLGRNKITGEVQRLTSWRSSDDPSPGPFSLSMDTKGSTNYFLKWNGSHDYWTSGAWNGHAFDGVPEMTLTYIYNFTYIDNKKWSSFFYDVYNSKHIVSRTVLDLSGGFQQLNWLNNSNTWMLFWSQPRALCEVYALCGPFGVCDQNALPYCRCPDGFEPTSARDWNLSDWSAGCRRKSPLGCGARSKISAQEQKDKFMVMPSVRLPANPQNPVAQSVDECEFACLNDCSCSAYAYDFGSTNCSLWKGDLLNLQQLSDGDSTGSSLLIRVSAASMPPGARDRKSIMTKVAAAVVSAILFIVIGISWKCHYRRKAMGSMDLVGTSLVPFKYSFLQSATRNFSQTLGVGGFGAVFKGVLPDSTEIAVKKLEGLQQGDKQFRAEVSTLGKIQHLNLVRLHGFCSSGAHRLLVYDYMSNGSLASCLFENKAKVLDWGTRYQILVGVARGMTYLHEKCRECIVHCDIKPENILLDADFCPKVADFGMAKLIGRDFSRVLTTMRGTRGYLAPEWLSGSPITPKADVYSYGMMVLEVLSGKRNTEQSEGSGVVFYPVWAAGRVTEGQLFELVDEKLEGDVDMDELRRACRVACWCIQDFEAYRPSMGVVVQILEGVVDVDIPSVPRFLQNLIEDQKSITFFSNVSADQVPHVSA